MNRYLLAVAVPLSCAVAQNAPPAFVPKEAPTVRMRAVGLPELREKWSATAIGKFFAEPDVEDLVAIAAKHVVEQEERRLQVYRAAADLQVELPWIEVRNLCTAGNPLGALGAAFSEFTQFEFFVTLRPDEKSFMRTEAAHVISCSPRYEGKWTRQFEDMAALHRRSGWFKEEDAIKVDGYSAYRFVPRAKTDSDRSGLGSEGVGKWFLHLPGTFIYGSGMPKELGSVDMAPAKETAGLHMDLGVRDYMTPFTQGAPVPAGVGLDLLQRLQLRETFDGDQIVEEFRLVLDPDGKHEGLVGALLSGGGKLAPQALPKGGIAQIRCAVDYKKLFAAAVALAEDELGTGLPLPEAVLGDIEKALDGSVSLGVCAPAPGGLIPRIYLTLGLADTEAFDRVIKWLVDRGMPTKNSKLAGHDCTTLRVPDMPQGISPAFCRSGNLLHIAESGRSLRSFLKAQKDGVAAMDVGDLEPAAGAGELVAGFETRFDFAQLYRSFYVNWLSLLELSNGGDMMIGKDEMPHPDDVEEHVGKLLGTVRRDGSDYVLRHRGPLGGPVLSAYLMMWGVVLEQSSDRATGVLSGHIAEARLEVIGKALAAFEKREQRLPKDLAELVVAQKLAADALFVPGDKLAEEFTLPSGDRLRSSFRYFPEGVEARCLEDGPAIMIQIASGYSLRRFLGRSGTVTSSYFTEARQGIDEFGK